MSGNVSNSVVKGILKEQKGMMTVEAAAIVPAVSLILVGVVFLFLFFAGFYKQFITVYSSSGTNLTEEADES